MSYRPDPIATPAATSNPAVSVMNSRLRGMAARLVGWNVVRHPDDCSLPDPRISKTFLRHFDLVH